MTSHVTLTDLLFEDAHQHIFIDLADTSECDALVELERILDSMPQALALMKRVAKLESTIRFLTSQLRDGKALLFLIMKTYRLLSQVCGALGEI